MTNTKFNLPLGFYTVYESNPYYLNSKKSYKTIEIIKITDKTITIRNDSGGKKIRKPIECNQQFHITLEQGWRRGAPLRFYFKDSYYTKHKPTLQELEDNFIEGEKIIS